MAGLEILIGVLIFGVVMIIYGLARWPGSEDGTMKSTILVVDDDGGIRKLLQDSLGADYHILEADDGDRGLSEILVGEQDIDLVITDLNMPRTDGVEFIENMPQGIPFIIISAYLQIAEYRNALDNLNPVAILEKPFRISALRDAVHQALAR